MKVVYGRRMFFVIIYRSIGIRHITCTIDNCIELKGEGAAHKIGPNLYGVVLRERAAAEGYKFSSALKKKSGKWSYADLLAFIGNPKVFAKGTKMTLKIRKAKDRADLVAYLRTLHDDPPPLPSE